MAVWGYCAPVQRPGPVPDDFLSSRVVESKKKAVQRLEEQLMKLEVQATDREEGSPWLGKHHALLKGRLLAWEG